MFICDDFPHSDLASVATSPLSTVGVVELLSNLPYVALATQVFEPFLYSSASLEEAHYIHRLFVHTHGTYNASEPFPYTDYMLYLPMYPRI